MKRMIKVIAAVCAALFVAGCATVPNASDSLGDARRNAPNNSLVGLAAVKANKNTGPKLAETQAKYQLARAMTFMLKDMVDDAVAKGQVQSGPAEEFRAAINDALSKNSLPSAVKLGDGPAKSGMYWAAYCMSKEDVVKLLGDAVNGAKARFPAMGAFTIDGRIDAAYATQSSKKWEKIE